MKNYHIVIALAAALCGCAQNFYWANPKNPSASFQADNALCENEAIRSVPVKVAPAPSSYSTNCTSLGYSIDCTSTPMGGKAYIDPYAFQNGLDQATYQQNCLIAKGWVKYRNNVVQVTGTDSNQSTSNFKDETSKWLTEYRANVCSLPELKNLFEKTPCGVAQFSIAQLRNQEYVSDEDRKAFEQFDSKNQPYRLRAIEINENLIRPPSAGQALAALLKKNYENQQSSQLDLLDKKITWGQYNTRRKESIENYAREFQSIMAQR